MASTAVDLYLKLVVVIGGIRNFVAMAMIVSWGMLLAHIITNTVYYACVHVRLISVFKQYYTVSNICG